MASQATDALLPHLSPGAETIANMEELQESILDKIATLPSWMLENWDMMLLEYRIIFSALGCIYLASHAALRRPPSAVAPNKSKQKPEDEHSDDEDQDFVQGLMPSDALMFPILAGIVLVGLYYLIRWLEDPEIINKIMRAYFSIMSLASMGKLLADALHMATGFLFPSVWTDKDGKLYRFDAVRRCQYYHPDSSDRRVWDENKTAPFPSRWAEMKLTGAGSRALWETRRLLLRPWTIHLSIYGVCKETFRPKLNDLLGFILSVVFNLIYLRTKSTALSNLMGYAFSYAGMTYMSPTTFTTGTMVLYGLFLYDIYMVFYTPYMVTVATKLDVPIKLVFDGPKRSSMLGLGDIVVPGMFIALCLRFDHYMYYHRQRKLEPVELKTEVQTADGVVTYTEAHRRVVKPTYINPQGLWGDRFWSTSLWNMFSPKATDALRASAFPKTYFFAAMVGYMIAMVATLVILLVFNHGQPALLYLVPGVTLAVWITGTVRGELRDMWIFTEDGSLDKTDQIVQLDGDGQVVKDIKDEVSGSNGKKAQDPEERQVKDAPEKKDDKVPEPAKEEQRKVFELSILTPSP